MAELKPCPFCGAKDVDIDFGEYYGTLRGRCYVCCDECGAEITSDTVAAAIRAWNRRAKDE